MINDDYIKTLLRGDRGGFAAKIAEAWCHADSGNRRAVERTFPGIFGPVDEDIQQLEGMDLIDALWWFIENVDNDNPNRSEMFFHLRERMRDI